MYFFLNNAMAWDSIWMNKLFLLAGFWGSRVVYANYTYVWVLLYFLFRIWTHIVYFGIYLSLLSSSTFLYCELLLMLLAHLFLLFWFPLHWFTLYLNMELSWTRTHEYYINIYVGTMGGFGACVNLAMENEYLRIFQWRF